MAGFNSPNILFLNTYDSLDRKYVRELAPKLLCEGYDRYVELYCGAFAMPLVMVDAGWKPEQIHCYDVSLFSNILGYVFSGRDLSKLEVRKNGDLIELCGDPLDDAALLLYEQALARMEKAVHIEYYRMVVEDMAERKSAHVEYLNSIQGESVTIDLPQLDFDWRKVELTFLPKQLKEFETLCKSVSNQTEIVGVAGREQFDAFSNAMIQYGRTMDIKSVGTVVSLLTEIALREIEEAKLAEEE